MRTNDSLNDSQTCKKPSTLLHVLGFLMRNMTGGATGIRTPDLLRAKQSLSQLSYRPRKCKMQSAECKRRNTFTFCILHFVVGVGGLEPPASILSGSRSNQLSYTPAAVVYHNNMRLVRRRAIRVPELPRKEVIQPHLPVRLPCYDFVPVAGPALGRCLGQAR
jgi:hypothetical protein